MNIHYRFLSQEDHFKIYEAKLTAFSDYKVPLQMTEVQFKNHLAQNAVDLSLSVGACDNEKIVGFTLNGFGVWHGKKTVYDAGTGVIPDYRNKGIGRTMFEFLLPTLKEKGFDQMLLEVISDNNNAIHLYRSLGFKETRKLLFFEQTEPIEARPDESIKIRQIEEIDWERLQSFCDGYTSWQFSDQSIGRKIAPTNFYGAYLGDECVGYSILFPTSGVVPQIAIDQDHRQKQVASMLLAEMQTKTLEGRKLRLSNIDSNLTSLIQFAERLKFEQKFSQIEMMLEF